jgi:hypothetical protein
MSAKKSKKSKIGKIKIKNLYYHSKEHEEDTSDWVKNIFPFGTWYLPPEVSDFFINMVDERDELKERLENLLGKRN